MAVDNELKSLSYAEYKTLEHTGLLNELHPTATGDWQMDCWGIASPKTASDNNGGSTDYYKIPNDYIDLQDKIEGDDFNFSQGNILKSAWTLGKGRHDGTTYERELNKIIFFAQRELDRL